jgi:NDP-sugar pyrophosphorylase family protein
LLKKAVIPLGGLGTRLYPLTVDTSKAMIRFLNRPLIEHILVSLASQGIKEFYIGVSGYYNYTQIHDYLGGGERIASLLGLQADSIRVRYQPNFTTSGNAESVKILMDYYDIKEPVLVVQGDIIFNIDLYDLWETHKSSEAIMTIVLKELDPSEDIRRFGVAVIDQNRMIRGFIEKPKTLEQMSSRLINTGVYIVGPWIREFFESERGRGMRAGGQTDFGSHVIPEILSRGERVRGYITTGYWFDIGTPESYMKASFHLLRTLAKEDLRVTRIYGGIKMMGRSPLSRSLHERIIAMVDKKLIKAEGNILLGRHIDLEEGVELWDAIIDNYTVVMRGSRVIRSIIMDRCLIGEKASIEGSILGRHVYVGRGARIVNSVIGNNVVIGEGSVIVGSKIWPGRTVELGSVIENKIYM